MDIHGPLQTRGETRCLGGVRVSCLASRTRHECPRHNKGYIWKLDTGFGPTLYKKCHSHNTPGKRHNNTWVEPLAGNCTTSCNAEDQSNTKSYFSVDLQLLCAVTCITEISLHVTLSNVPINLTHLCAKILLFFGGISDMIFLFSWWKIPYLFICLFFHNFFSLSPFSSTSACLPPLSFILSCLLTDVLQHWGRRGFKSRIRPPYPQRVVKGD